MRASARASVNPVTHPLVRHWGSKARKGVSKELRDGRDGALGAAIAQIESSYGVGTVMRLGERVLEAHPVVSTGSLLLDGALGIGGLPKGRVVEVYGPEASGKTTIALHVVAEAQKQGGTCVFIDAEHALDMKYAAAVGVDVKELLITQPDSGEQALEIADTLVRSGGVDVMIIDSVAALVPKAELEGEMGDPHMALQARLMSQALRKISHSLSRSNTLLIFTNQVRSKLNSFPSFGPQEVTSGGKALKYYASVRLDVRRTGSVKLADGSLGGNTVKVKVAKNKMAPPFREVEIEMEFGRGISKEAELLDLAVKLGRITKSGAWYAYDGERIGQGKEKVKAYLRENPAVTAALLDAVGGTAATETGGEMPTVTATVSSKPSGDEHTEDDGFDPAFAEEDDSDEQVVAKTSGAGP